MSDVPGEVNQPPVATWGAVAQSPSESISREPFSFTGTGREYFGIWIVNVLLTIVTLGIYSAWAKVRSTRYFYDNTYVAGASFDYHGNPRAILKGRLIALVMVLSYNFAFKFSWVLGVVTASIVASIAPWLIWKSLQFKLHNSSYRGIRFGFRGSLGGAYETYLKMPFIAVITLGFGIPFMSQRIKRFQHEESRFGSTHFSFTASVKRFYMTYGWMLLIVLGVVASLMILGFLFGFATRGYKRVGSPPSAMLVFTIVMLTIYLPMFVLTAIFRSMIQNMVWNHTQLGDHAFDYRLEWRRLAGIYLTNLLAIIITLGLYTPFAKIRLRKYQLEAMTLVRRGSIDDFVAQAESPSNAIGEGAMDLMDFDISL